MKPSNFKAFPMGSVMQKSEAETIAHNIMVILSRTGDNFRSLTWDEYKEEREKDGNFSEGENIYFYQVINYCISPEAARLLSPVWGEAYLKDGTTSPEPSPIGEDVEGFTEGEWSATGLEIRHKNRSLLLATVYEHLPANQGRDEALANAKLISISPTLYRENKELREALEAARISLQSLSEADCFDERDTEALDNATELLNRINK